MTTRADASAVGRVAGLDGLRAVAALSVFVFHLAEVSPQVRATSDSFVFYTRHLDVGVAIFFVLSGFVVTRPFLAGRATPAPVVPVGGYALRRVLRIGPAWWVFLAGAVAFGWLDHVSEFSGNFAPDSPLHVLAWATLTHGWWFQPVHVSWTLSVEVVMYALVPLWAGAIRRVPRARWKVEVAGAGLLVACGLVATWTRWFRPPETRFAAVVVQPLIAFGAGMLLAAVAAALVGTDREARVRRALGTTGIWWSAAAVLYLVLARQIVDAPPTILYGVTGSTRVLFARDLVQVVIAVLLVGSVVFADPDRSRVVRLLTWRPLAAVGLVSYGIYLWHTTVLRWWRWSFTPAELAADPSRLARLGEFGGPGRGWRDGFFALLLTLVIATASYAVVERPARRLAGRRR